VSPPLLTRFVAGHRATTRGGSQRAYVRLPDGGVDLLIRVSGGDAEVLVGGARQHAFRKLVDDAPESLVLHFRPGGAYSFFGLPLSELTDRFVSIDRLWPGAERLREQLASADAAARLPLVEAALVARLRGALFEPGGAPAVRRALALIESAPTLPGVAELSRGLGVSPRQLRRTFDAVVGVAPKTYLRIQRFQRAMRRARQARVRDWSAIAAATGYYDQAHLIAHFRDLAGVTPGAVLREL
jgi:AraC-like DNA-binding protein